MIDDFVGISDLSQGLAFVTLLPTRLIAGRFAQTRHPRRLLQPIARRRLAAVRTVQSEPALKFGDLFVLLLLSGTTPRLLATPEPGRAGAREVHVRIHSPQMRYPCYMGVDTVYHDRQHTLDITLALARLLVGGQAIDLATRKVEEVVASKGAESVPIESWPRMTCRPPTTRMRKKGSESSIR